MYLVTGYPNYRYCKRGHVYSKRGKVWKRLKPALDKGGYLYVCLYREKKGKTFKVHRLIAESHLGGRPEGMETRHLDGNKKNNRPSNLEYGTPAENTLDKILHGTIQTGHMNPNAKFSLTQIKNIRTQYEEGGISMKTLAVKYGVRRITIKNIIEWKTYKD